MAKRSARFGIAVALAANVFLLVLKATATGWSDSLTIFSETLNSLADVLGALVILVFVPWALRSHDEDHPFGHSRAEPIAGLTLAIFTAILGIEVVRHAVLGLMEGSKPAHIGTLPIVALIVTALIKGTLARYFFRLGDSLNSPAFRAAAIDSRNDVLVAGQALAGVLLAFANLGVFDRISALLVGLYILAMAYHVGMENINYLMGKAPDASMREEIRRTADGVSAVREVDDVRAHYVGTGVHVELTTRVDADLSTKESHTVAEEVREAVESIPGVDRAFVHIEPHETPARECEPVASYCSVTSTGSR